MCFGSTANGLEVGGERKGINRIILGFLKVVTFPEIGKT